jgi:bile acid-coenzyme A ligase
MRSYGSTLTARAGTFAHQLALVHVDAHGVEQEITWAELERRANQTARFLADRGVREGDVVAIALPNLPEHFFATYGAWKLGATVLPMRWGLPEWERSRLVQLAQPAVVVAETGDGGTQVGLEDVRMSEALDATPLPDRIAEPAYLIATSGSTGQPKLIVAAGPAALEDSTVSAGLVVTGEDVIQLVTSPLYHTNGFMCHLRLMNGGQLIVMQRFDASRAVELVKRWNVNQVVLVPTMLQRIARLADLAAEDLSSLRNVYYGGAPLPSWVARRWIDLVGPEHFFFQYGGTEQLGGCLADGSEWLSHEGTVGRPVGCTVRILGDDGTPLPPNQIGEIFMCRDDGHRFRYIGAPMPKMTDDGYSTYGDLGWLDTDGYLYIADRRVDMVVTGGANVYPAEVELALSEHPGIGDAVVVGLPDEEWGQRLHAIIEPLDPLVPPSGDDLRAHCQARLAPYKVPKSFEIVEHLPRTEAGKINRSSLIEARSAPGPISVTP